jgi:ATP dependent DNA ligase domain
MVLQVPLSLQPMEATPVENLPNAKGWLFEPKYDGFRCILFRDQDTVNLQSRRQRPLDRYFPEIVEATRKLPVQRFVFDGELIIPDEPFDTLQLRLHPAESRVRLLSHQLLRLLHLTCSLTIMVARSLISRSVNGVLHLKLYSSRSGRTGVLCSRRPRHLGRPHVAG